MPSDRSRLYQEVMLGYLTRGTAPRYGEQVQSANVLFRPEGIHLVSSVGLR